MGSDAIGFVVALRAKEAASKMFSSIGVKLYWRRECPAQSGPGRSFCMQCPAMRRSSL
jgi:hypothetical protein